MHTNKDKFTNEAKITVGHKWAHFKMSIRNKNCKKIATMAKMQNGIKCYKGKKKTRENNKNQK